MKKFIVFSLIFAAGFTTSCTHQAQPQILKPISASSKSVAVPVSNAYIGVDARWGNSVVLAPFLHELKTELRNRGWRVIVDGVTGRGGANNSINCGAAYTIITNEQGQSIWQGGLVGQMQQSGVCNLVMVENATGEEVLNVRGKVTNAAKLAMDVANALDRSAR